jgi:hypothetical protein
MKYSAALALLLVACSTTCNDSFSPTGLGQAIRRATFFRMNNAAPHPPGKPPPERLLEQDAVERTLSVDTFFASAAKLVENDPEEEMASVQEILKAVVEEEDPPSKEEEEAMETETVPSTPPLSGRPTPPSPPLVSMETQEDFRKASKQFMEKVVVSGHLFDKVVGVYILRCTFFISHTMAIICVGVCVLGSISNQSFKPKFNAACLQRH